jgi:hypothetical protein
VDYRDILKGATDIPPLILCAWYGCSATGTHIQLDRTMLCDDHAKQLRDGVICKINPTSEDSRKMLRNWELSQGGTVFFRLSIAPDWDPESDVL